VANTYTQAEADARYPLNTSAFFAGKNKIINGDFFVNQRSFTSTTAGGFTFDRWRHGSAGGTVTTTAQTFTVGTAPVAGYEGKNFIQQATTGQSAAGDYSFIGQSIEGVRTFAGQTVTVSFWAKASAGTPKVGLTLRQVFGTGGSTTVSTADAGQVISTSWARYTSTITLPSIAGKTIAGGDDLLDLLINTSTGSTLAGLGWSNIGIQNSTIAVWGIQVEAGTVATAFQTATGTIQGELAACQRYYIQWATGTNKSISLGFYLSTTFVYSDWPFPVTMRTTPTIVITSGTNYYLITSAGGGNDYVDAFAVDAISPTVVEIYNATQASGTAGQACRITTANAAASIGFSAEL
jgi:hypothetical protein